MIARSCKRTNTIIANPSDETSKMSRKRAFCDRHCNRSCKSAVRAVRYEHLRRRSASAADSRHRSRHSCHYGRCLNQLVFSGRLHVDNRTDGARLSPNRSLDRQGRGRPARRAGRQIGNRSQVAWSSSRAAHAKPTPETLPETGHSEYRRSANEVEVVRRAGGCCDALYLIAGLGLVETVPNTSEVRQPDGGFIPV